MHVLWRNQQNFPRKNTNTLELLQRKVVVHTLVLFFMNVYGHAYLQICVYVWSTCFFLCMCNGSCWPSEYSSYTRCRVVIQTYNPLPWSYQAQVGDLALARTILGWSLHLWLVGILITKLVMAQTVLRWLLWLQGLYITKNWVPSSGTRRPWPYYQQGLSSTLPKGKGKEQTPEMKHLDENNFQVGIYQLNKTVSGRLVYYGNISEK